MQEQRRAEPGTAVVLESVPNLRDIGGWPTGSGGVVKRGVLFRSGRLDSLVPPDMDTLTGLGIRSVYDLRTRSEATTHPDQLPPKVDYMLLDVLAETAATSPARSVEALTDPALAEEVFGGGELAEIYAVGYREFITLSSAKAAYRRLFLSLSQPGVLPALIHCTTGKDRTGWAAAALLLFLGVSEEDVVSEYLLSNDQLLPYAQPYFDRFAAAGGDPDLLRPAFGIKRQYLQGSLNTMRARFGSIDGYFTDGLDIDLGTQERLRRNFSTNADE